MSSLPDRLDMLPPPEARSIPAGSPRLASHTGTSLLRRPETSQISSSSNVGVMVAAIHCPALAPRLQSAAAGLKRREPQADDDDMFRMDIDELVGMPSSMSDSAFCGSIGAERLKAPSLQASPKLKGFSPSIPSRTLSSSGSSLAAMRAPELPARTSNNQSQPRRPRLLHAALADASVACRCYGPLPSPLVPPPMLPLKALLPPRCAAAALCYRRTVLPPRCAAAALCCCRAVLLPSLPPPLTPPLLPPLLRSLPPGLVAQAHPRFGFVGALRRIA